MTHVPAWPDAPVPGDLAPAIAETLRRLGEQATPPAIRALHLPPAPPDDDLAGESCAVELADGSVGLTYVLGGATLRALRRAPPDLAGADPLAVAAALVQPPGAADGVPRTLAFAAASAVTSWLWRRAGFEPPAATDSLGGVVPVAGESVGMVGWFPPLVPRIVAAGATLTVVELRAELHGLREGARVVGDPSALAACDRVLCTGTALLNGTLASLRAAAARARSFVLIGPTAGVLPDAVFAAGIDAVGGSWITDGPGFVAALRAGERRGDTHRKTLLRAGDHPGLDALLLRLG